MCVVAVGQISHGGEPVEWARAGHDGRVVSASVRACVRACGAYGCVRGLVHHRCVVRVCSVGGIGGAPESVMHERARTTRACTCMRGAWMARAGTAAERGLGRGYMPGESQGINIPCVVTD